MYKSLRFTILKNLQKSVEDFRPGKQFTLEYTYILSIFRPVSVPPTVLKVEGVVPNL